MMIFFSFLGGLCFTWLVGIEIMDPWTNVSLFFWIVFICDLEDKTIDLVVKLGTEDLGTISLQSMDPLYLYDGID
jgi:hypothetical protein